MQRLTAELTEAVHLSQGHTRLYLPTEPLDNPTAAVTDKASQWPLALISLLLVLCTLGASHTWRRVAQLMTCGGMCRTWCSGLRASCCTGHGRLTSQTCLSGRMHCPFFFDDEVRAGDLPCVLGFPSQGRLHAQVKHVLNQQDTAGTKERDGPFAEIGFWQHRGDNLSGIQLQLGAPGERCRTCGYLL